jgi:hypothetical protein
MVEGNGRLEDRPAPSFKAEDGKWRLHVPPKRLLIFTVSHASRHYTS